MGTMLILRGIAGHFDGRDWPKGALDEPSAIAYARARGYEPVVLDVAGATGPGSEQTRAAIRAIRKGKLDVTALYGFSGGGYNIRHILIALTQDERARLKLVVVIGAPNNPIHYYSGFWELVYRKDPKTGHMDGPKVLLAELTSGPVESSGPTGPAGAQLPEPAPAPVAPAVVGLFGRIAAGLAKLKPRRA